MKKMIFHLPLPLNVKLTNASGIRPNRMIEAFKRLGYQVYDVTGYGKERKKKIKYIKKKILSGEKFDFLYAEASTLPTILTEKHHFPTYPFLDFKFFEFCKNKGLKIGLFYRDIYWLFPIYLEKWSFYERIIGKIFYKYDLKKYNQLVDIVYLPSIKMGEYIPFINPNKFKELPPGHDEYRFLSTKNIKEKIELIYVGGLGVHYQLHKLFKVLKKFTKIHFTLCTRKKDWQNAKDEYELSENISIVHKTGIELEKLYQQADIGILFVKPIEYWKFAAPFKLYEYIGKEKPIIASRGTFAGRFVEENNIGWNIEYDEKALEKLFSEILNDFSVIFNKKKNIQIIKQQHSWEARAREVVRDLTDEKKKVSY